MIVSNTTPISNLLHLDQFRLVASLCREVHVPEPVRDEVDQAFARNREWREALDGGRVQVHKVTNDVLIQQLRRTLHRGEAETVALGVELGAKLCLMDDRDARAVAEGFGIRLTGTLGLLLKAKQLGLLSSVRVLVGRLRDRHHFWISPRMYQEFVRLAGEQ
ncbi:MAG: hypothetical protein A3K19_05520 [Lentisphaerae bacterium RIFOXYB12_FULL_65_16]|nr:MAG: hypothetical protein A3K18_15705 [Lentisphaerae bacterium RIFOXYA12_64_32]OGV94351.1 MAG: hypothetical protein A3K19_05520 [Lentisphaerae bacterium RIFOXYB12_FULL_65_16]